MKKLTDHFDVLTALLKDRPKIVILTHKNPDGDAVGSMLALYHFLLEKSERVTAVSPDDFPDFLNWLPGSDQIAIHLHRRKKLIPYIEEADIIFCLDFNQLSRIDSLEKYVKRSKAVKILIDHHPSPTPFIDYAYSDTSASSTAELLFHILKKLNGNNPLPKKIAECLFAGIMTDTGCFSHNASNPETWEIVSELLKTGINKDEIFYSVYDNYSSDRMRLMGYCLNNKMQVFPEYQTALITITQKELKKFNYKPGDTEGFVNMPLSVKNIKLSALFIEKKEYVKTSFRSKGSFGVNWLAKEYYKGGGHRNAAGGESELPMDKAIEKFVKLIKKYKKEIAGE